MKALFESHLQNACVRLRAPNVRREAMETYSIHCGWLSEVALTAYGCREQLGEESCCAMIVG